MPISKWTNDSPVPYLSKTPRYRTIYQVKRRVSGSEGDHFINEGFYANQARAQRRREAINASYDGDVAIVVSHQLEEE